MVHAGGDRRARARHRRQCDRLHLCERRADPGPALRRIRPDRDRDHAQHDAAESRRGLLSGSRGLARPGEVFLRTDVLPADVLQRHRQRTSTGTHASREGVRQCVQPARTADASRQRLPPARRQEGGGAGRHPGLWIVEIALRRRPGRARPVGQHQRHAGDDCWRHARGREVPEQCRHLAAARAGPELAAAGCPEHDRLLPSGAGRDPTRRRRRK